MILTKDILNVTIGKTVFRSSPFQNPQFVLDDNALTGFYDGVNIKRTEAPRPNQWGDFPEPALLGPRTLVLTGTAVANTPQQLHDMRDEFTSLLVDGGYSEIAIQNLSDTRYISVSLGQNPSWVPKIDTAAVWKLELYAPDPRIYSYPKIQKVTDGTIGGGLNYPVAYPMNYGGSTQLQAVTIYNDGNSPSWPVFTVTGNFFTGFEITDGLNSVIRYDSAVTMQAPVIIDTAKGSAMQMGADNSRYLSRRDWFSIPPKSSIQPKFVPFQDAAGWCDIMYRDTWI
jgi:hypothetical protein